MELLLFVVVAIGVYMLPWFIAMMRGSPNTVPIFFLNLLLGWSVLGWVAALIWSVMPKPTNVTSFNSQPPPDGPYVPPSTTRYI